MERSEYLAIMGEKGVCLPGTFYRLESDEGLYEAVVGEAAELARIFDACPDDDLITYHVEHCMRLAEGYAGVPAFDVMNLVEVVLRHGHGYFFEFSAEDRFNHFVKRESATIGTVA